MNEENKMDTRTNLFMQVNAALAKLKSKRLLTKKEVQVIDDKFCVIKHEVLEEVIIDTLCELLLFLESLLELELES